MPLERRDFLRLSGAAAMGGALVAANPVAASAHETAPSLTEAETVTLKVLLRRMLPADYQGGGAVEAGAHIYIDRALAGAHARHLEAYREGLRVVDGILSNGSGATMQNVDALIAGMEAGTVRPEFPDGGTAFFSLVRNHLLEGMFGDPAYGGNRDFMGWQLIGFPGVQLIFSAAEQQVDGPRASHNRSLELFGGKART